MICYTCNGCECVTQPTASQPANQPASHPSTQGRGSQRGQKLAKKPARPLGQPAKHSASQPGSQPVRQPEPYTASDSKYRIPAQFRIPGSRSLAEFWIPACQLRTPGFGFLCRFRNPGSGFLGPLSESWLNSRCRIPCPISNSSPNFRKLLLSGEPPAPHINDRGSWVVWGGRGSAPSEKCNIVSQISRVKRGQPKGRLINIWCLSRHRAIHANVPALGKSFQAIDAKGQLQVMHVLAETRAAIERCVRVRCCHIKDSGILTTLWKTLQTLSQRANTDTHTHTLHKSSFSFILPTPRCQ